LGAEQAEKLLRELPNGAFCSKNTKSFLRAAGRDLEEGEYDLAVFHAKQALQLCAKYSLYVKYGDYPKTHRLKELLGALGQSYDSLIVDLLEEACIGAGCLPVRYSGETARRAIAETECLTRCYVFTLIKRLHELRRRHVENLLPLPLPD
jgi:HEPN domain-containing protein